MATLVLTAVGTAVGGPIGGAIGAFVGGQVDQNILFKPKGREGPRLQELAVQTSSYGTQVPRIFGKMRVAGTVVWATDIKETKSTDGGGKGRPKTTTYSYSACFVVAVSSRSIESIGRIWADGKLFRGSAGDFKTPTGFRFHDGAEDQVADSLISSAEGPSGTPAHRGFALAVFEDMDLTDYGNRIPSLTFEVIADIGPVELNHIVDDISDQRVSVTSDQKLDGFAAAGDDRRLALSSILGSFPMSFSFEDGVILGQPRAGDGDEIFGFGDSSIVRQIGSTEVDRPEYQSAPESKVPRQYSLRYYDPARDYQSGLQNAFRPGASRVVARQDFPAAIEADQAKAIAQTKLWLDYQERRTVRLTVLRSASSLLPGSVITLPANEGLWRIRALEMRGSLLEISASRMADGFDVGDNSTDQGRSISELDAPAGSTHMILADLPFAADAPSQVSNVPRLYALAAGDLGWRNADVFAAAADGSVGEYVGQIPGPATIGMVEEVLGGASPFLVDCQNSIVVQLHNADMDLFEADDQQLIAGKNIALIGAEVFQFGKAVPLGNKRYRLSRLIRGLGGTETEIGLHQSNEGFGLIESAVAMEIEPEFFSLFQPSSFFALGREDDEPVQASIASPGLALRAWSPVHPIFKHLPSGALEISWTRRSRAGLAWLDHVEVPLAEEAEKYKISLSDGAGNFLESSVSDSPIYTVPAASLQDYKDTGVTSLSVEVAQVGQFRQSPSLRFSISI